METPNIVKHLLYMSISRCHHRPSRPPQCRQRRERGGRGRGVTSHSSKLTGSECVCWYYVGCWFSVQQTSISNFSFENFYISASQKFTSKKRTKLNLTSAWKEYFVHSGIERFNERQHFLYTSASERQIV